MNPIYAEAVRQIRLTNPTRTIFIGTGAFNGVAELIHLILPDSDINLIATVHTYDPFLFTHQGLPWAGADVATTPIQFPGPPAFPVIPAAGLSPWASNWLDGYNALPPDRNPCGPAGFHYLANGAPDPTGLREALFPRPVLQRPAVGVVQFDAAIGKVYVIERAWGLSLPLSWTPISTQSLATPKFSFTDGGSGEHPAAFYRVKWVK